MYIIFKFKCILYIMHEQRFIEFKVIKVNNSNNNSSMCL